MRQLREALLKAKPELAQAQTLKELQQLQRRIRRRRDYAVSHLARPHVTHLDPWFWEDLQEQASSCAVDLRLVTQQIAELRLGTPVLDHTPAEFKFQWERSGNTDNLGVFQCEVRVWKS